MTKITIPPAFVQGARAPAQGAPNLEQDRQQGNQPNRLGGGRRQWAIGERPPAAATLPPGATRRPDLSKAGLFDQKERDQLQLSNKVLILEYSSTGGGHTARSLNPILGAIENGTLNAGDTVVALAPPRWPSDTNGGKVNTLHDFADKIRSKGLHVILKQSDKTVTGIYQHGGASDNVAMLRDFVEKPGRNKSQIPLSNRRIVAGNDAVVLGEGNSAKDILDGVVGVIGEENISKLLVVLGDMAPYLQKAAKALGITKSLEVGNHQGLFIGAARAELGKKDLSYLAKASSAGLSPNLALVEYSADLNVVSDLKGAMVQLAILPETTKQEAREKVLDHVFRFAKINTPDIAKTGGLLMAEGLEKEDVRAMVYLYVNEYTPGVVAHLKEQIAAAGPDSAYANTVFAICGSNAIDLPSSDPDELELFGIANAKNILHLMYLAMADGVTNAGFGTTSEFFYLARNGSEASFVVVPVENQHEQEANAAMLTAAFATENAAGSRLVVSARGAPAMNAQIDTLVSFGVGRSTDPEYLQGDMSQIVKAASNPKSGSGHAAELLKKLEAEDANEVQAAMRPNARTAILKMAENERESAPKERRRVYKLMVPALDAIISGRTSFNVRATSKVPATEITLDRAAALMQKTANPDFFSEKALKDLLRLPIKNPEVRALMVQLGARLAALSAIENNDARKAAARDALHALATQDIALGW